MLEFGQLGLSGAFLWSELRTIDHYRKGLEAAMTGAMSVASWPIVGAYFYTFRGLPYPPLNPVDLTERECRVLQLMADGLTQPEIAAHFGIAERTVQRIVAEARSKLGAENEFALAVKATLLGVVY